MISELKSSSYKYVKEIKKGWSADKKYYIETFDNQKLLMRISDIALHARKQEEFKLMRRTYALNISMSKPLDFGVCKDKLHIFTLLTWIEGNDAEEAIPSLPDEKQYALGIEAGETLKKIHSIKPDTELEDWSIRYSRKIDEKIRLYNSCEIKVPQDKKIIEYIQNNRYLLQNRPICFQHGDYHIGNMILSDDNKLSIIDFNRYDFGDPYEEFNRIPFSAIKCPLFAKGMLNGYFDNNVPANFFKLCALYICVNILASFPWAIPYGKKEVDFMINMIQQTMNWYDDMNQYVPNWYSNDRGTT